MTPDFIKAGKRSMSGHSSWSRPTTAGDDSITHGGDSTQPAVVVPWGRQAIPDDPAHNKADVGEEGGKVSRRSALNNALLTGTIKHTAQSRKPDPIVLSPTRHDPDAPLEDVDWDSDAGTSSVCLVF